MGSLNLIDVDLRFSTPERDGFVSFYLHIVVATLGVELDPITDHRWPDDAIEVIRCVEANAIPDHVSVVTGCDNLLSAICRESAEFVETDFRQQRHHVRPSEV